MINVGYKQSHDDHTFFVKHSTSMGVTAQLGYVDDIIVIGNDLEEREAMKLCLGKEFEIQELGRLKYFLGIEVAHSKKRIFVSPQKHVLDLLQEIGKTRCKPADKPIDLNHKLGDASEDAAIDKYMYQRSVGRLIHLSHM